MRKKIEHAPVASTAVADPRGRDASHREDAVEPVLVAVVTSMGRHAKIHPTMATPGESLPEGYARSSTGFLICNTILEVKVDQ